MTDCNHKFDLISKSRFLTVQFFWESFGQKWKVVFEGYLSDPSWPNLTSNDLILDLTRVFEVKNMGICIPTYNEPALNRKFLFLFEARCEPKLPSATIDDFISRTLINKNTNLTIKLFFKLSKLFFFKLLKFSKYLFY